MPNGTTNLLLMNGSELALLVGGMNPDTEIGVGDGQESVIVGVLRRAIQLERGEIRVMEQDHSWFITHLRAGLVSVGEESPLRGRLTRWAHDNDERRVQDLLATGHRRADGGPRFDSDSERRALAAKDGWLAGPFCGGRFTVHDPLRWVKGRHTFCGGAITLSWSVPNGIRR